MSAERDSDAWVAACSAAIRGDFVPLERIARPILHSIARHISPTNEDDLVQVALVKIWRRAASVDLARAATVKPYVLKIGERAMRDEERSARSGRETPSEELEIASRRDRRPEWVDGSITALCMRSIRARGDVADAMRATARRVRSSVHDVETRIRSEIRRAAISNSVIVPDYPDDEDVLASIRARAKDTVTTMPTETKEPTSLKIERVRIDSISADPANVRKHGKRNIEAIVASLRRFGQQKPIVVTSDGVVIAGNGTLEAARSIGWSNIAIVRTSLTGAQAAAYSIADNQTSDLSEFDDEALAKLLAGIKLEDEDLLATIGFSENELAGFIKLESLNGETDPDDIPEPPDAATTRPGDLWILGNHRLLCGDSGSRKDLDRLLAGGPVHMVNTDPPYNVKVEPRSNNAIAAGNSSFAAPKRTHHQSLDLARHPEKSKPTTKKMRAKDRPLANDFVTDVAFDGMLDAWFGNIARVLRPGHAFYIWGGYANCANYPPVLKKHNLYFSQAIIWVKGHPVLTRKDFMGNHEWCFYGWLEGAAHRYFGPNNATDVWDVKKVNPQSMVHLTEKPVELATTAIGYSSREGETVLDLFGGSGSTLIGCEQTSRHARLMELDPPYCDVIVQRWEKFTGKKAELERA